MCQTIIQEDILQLFSFHISTKPYSLELLCSLKGPGKVQKPSAILRVFHRSKCLNSCTSYELNTISEHKLYEVTAVTRV